MKKIIFLTIILVFVELFLFSCDNDTTTNSTNQAPGELTNPSPADNAVDISTTPTLIWECTDPESDPITYNVYLGISIDSLELQSQSQTASSYTVDTLDFETEYFWKIVAIDDHENQTEGEVWAFTTLSEPNQAPGELSNPSPADNAVDVSISPTLTWECTDPENDPVIYDVFFGTNADSLQLISQNQTASSYESGSLAYETVYFWRIIAYDDCGNQTDGDIWTFTTEASPVIEFTWSVITAGEFTYGEEDSIRTIDYDYEIMTYPVTNYQFAQYLNEELANGNIFFLCDTIASGWWEGYGEGYAAGYYDYIRDITDGKTIDWNGEAFTVEAGKENHPVVEVTWIGANAFANYYNWRLPTEEEWEKAARGNTGYDFPWGDVIDATRANYRLSNDPYEDEESHNTTPVDFYNGENHDGFQTTDSPSPYGVYDLLGNVWELTGSWNLDTYVVFRGNSYATLVNSLHICNRSDFDPDECAENIGFRCVRDN